eukprot:9894856-Prorocentrum_lima.AAC.1
MTSSLVGSEMCIRDRSRDGKGADLLCQLLMPRPQSMKKKPLQHNAAKTVSYTHLTLPTICSV